MSVRRSTGSKPLAFVTALMVVLTLVIPFVGTALANHGAANNPETVTLSPDSDTEQVGTCNAFTIQASRGANFAEGETIDVRAFQSDGDNTKDLQISFCDPDAAGPGSNLGGGAPNPASGLQTGNDATPAQGTTDCDEATTGFFGTANVPNEGACPGGGVTNNEAPADIRDECFTNSQGTCTFGVVSNEAGTMTVEAFFEQPGTEDNLRDTDPAGGVDPFDVSTKTWTGTPPGAAANLTCTPASDFNPEGTRHEFQCTATDANGRAVSGATVQFDVTAGPNAEEVTQSTCGPTNASGQTATPATENPAGSGQNPAAPTANACGYNDNLQGAANSPPGQDTIVAWINLGAQPGQPAPTTGRDPGEPSATITKTWVGPGRTIDCEPETATNRIGTSHTVTCTVRDLNNNPVQGVGVTISHTGGPGTLAPGGAGGQNQVTNAAGQVTATISTGVNDPTGTSTIRGTITANGQQAATECARAANDPSPSPAGVCADDVTKTWTRQGPPECNDNVDNDGDGRIDFGNDPGCASVDDDSESPDPGQDPEEVRHDRNIRITRFRHIDIPRRRADALLVKGRVTVTDGFTECATAVPIKVQIRLGGEWITRKTDDTNANGVFKVLIRDVPARYRAIAVPFQILDEDLNQLHICERARHARRHSH